MNNEDFGITTDYYEWNDRVRSSVVRVHGTDEPLITLFTEGMQRFPLFMLAPAGIHKSKRYDAHRFLAKTAFGIQHPIVDIPQHMLDTLDYDLNLLRQKYPEAPLFRVLGQQYVDPTTFSPTLRFIIYLGIEGW